MFFGGSVITERFYIDVKQDLKKKKKKVDLLDKKSIEREWGRVTQ